ncbi:MAG: GFA family protein [Candidatus Binatia bacterium]
MESVTPYPFMYCYCSICRKTTGALTCNIMGRRDTLRFSGKKYLRCYHARLRQPGRPALRSRAERWFCTECGTHLFVLDDRWPDGVWPNAAAIDTPLSEPPEHVHVMLRYKPAWVPVPGKGPRYPEYPELSIADWHERHSLTLKVPRSPKGRRRHRS